MAGWERSNAIGLMVFGVILAVGMVGSAWIVMKGVEYVKLFDTSMISVTGSSHEVVDSDTVKWVGRFTRVVDTTDVAALETAYARLRKDLAEIVALLGEQGFRRDELVISPVQQNPRHQRCGYQSPPGCVDKVVGYDLGQTVTLDSDQVQRVTALAQDMTPFLKQGINLATQTLAYYYSKLPQMRRELLAKAIHDAQQRAESIARTTGAQVGPLRSVDSGVFQVTALHSTNVSSVGVYNTATITKRITGVVHASFVLER